MYEIAEDADQLFIAMELLEGQSLAARLAAGPLAPPEALPIMLATLGALEALHTRGIVHRDLKPTNVFLTSYGVKLLDFGLARKAADDSLDTSLGLTLPGYVIGTPAYMAPEQLSGQAIDARTDLFSAGSVLYEMLSAKPPFAADSVMGVFHAVTYDHPPVLTGSATINAVDRIIHHAQEKEPEARYQTAAVMADDIRAAMLVSDARDSSEVLRARAVTRLIVLPFRILRPDPETDFLAVGLADGITGSLSGLQSLVVRSSLAASRFSSDTPDLKAIAAEADVDAVLTGTLMRAGDQLRVTAQLLEAPAGTVLWSQTAQAPLGGLFELQDGFSHRIVESLSIPLTPREQQLLKHDVPATARAYEFYLRANQHGYTRRTRDMARDLYLQCVSEDPQYAPAWARLGRVYRLLGNHGDPARSTENLQRAEHAFKRALELNPELPIAHNLYASLEVDLGRAQEAMLRLITCAQQQRADPELFAGLVYACRYCGLLDASVAAYEQARRLDPNIRTSVCQTFWAMGDNQRAIETEPDDEPMMGMLQQLREGRVAEVIDELKAREQKLQEVYVPGIRAFRAALEGDHEEFARAFQAQSPFFRDPEDMFYWSCMAAYAGDSERALDTLQRAVNGGWVCFAALAREPWLDPLRRNPRFTDILRTAEARHREAAAAFLRAGGDRVLNVKRLE